MGLKLYRFINLNNKKFSIKFFNQRLPFVYILFNFLYKNLIINSKIEDKEIKKFHKSGFTKIDISLKKEIEEYKEKFFLNIKELKEEKKKNIL